jgi:hypothetical protein
MAHGDDHGHGPAWIDPEQRDADIPLVIKTGIGILLGVVICMFIAAFQFRFESAEAPKGDESIFSAEGKLPPLPRLQAFPSKDLAAFKEQQLAKAENFGWADKTNEIARVPLEKAEEMVLKAGLPVWDRSKPIQLAPEKPAPKPGAPGAPASPAPAAAPVKKQ